MKSFSNPGGGGRKKKGCVTTPVEVPCPVKEGGANTAKRDDTASGIASNYSRIVLVDERGISCPTKYTKKRGRGIRCKF